MSFTASAAGRFGATAGNAPRLSNKAAAAAGCFGDGAAPCVDSAGRFCGSAAAAGAARRVKMPYPSPRQRPAASSRRLPQQRQLLVPAATAAARLPSRRRRNVDDRTCVAQAETGRQPASPGGCCTSELCQYRISFVTMALRDTLCNDSNDRALIRSDREGMTRERYPLDKVQGSKCRNTSCATLPLMDKL